MCGSGCLHPSSREYGWKDVKVGRIFKSSDCLHPESNPGPLTPSQYLAQMGGYKAFADNMEALIEDYRQHQEQMVFLTGGAPWLRNWIAVAFPGAHPFRIFYHLLEHLYVFAEAFFSDKAEGKQWVEQQKELLLAYLQANQNRMDYKGH